MDIYGFVPWQSSSSDELSNQIYAQQALAGNDEPYNRVVPERHMMPMPSGAPWNVQGVPWGMPTPQPQLVQFTAQTSPTEGALIPVVHCKRKPDDIEPVIPAKQLITEEKMAAHLQGLHISSEYTSHSSEEMMDVLPSTSSVTDRLKGHTIVLSEEIKKIQQEPLLPPALIERLEKPCMSLVIWEPKENILDKLEEEEGDKREQNRTPSVASTSRNGVLVPDLTVMDVEM